MIIFLTGYPQVGKTTLCEQVSKNNSMRYVDVTHQIHHHVFAYYKITDTKIQNDLLNNKDKPFWCFSNRTLRQECIRMGEYMGDKYWMDNVIFRFFDQPLVPLLASSVKNIWQIDYVASRTNQSLLDMVICQINRPGYHISDNCREPLPPNIVLNNEGTPEGLHQEFIIKINQLLDSKSEKRRTS